MTQNYRPIKRALLSVSNKTGLVEFAQNLVKLNVDIVSTGGTSQLLQEANIPHRQIDQLTGLPEMLDGRVKTLHPKVHGGILGKRDKHQDQAETHGIEWIDLVVVNFYPFEKAIQQKTMSWDEAVEYIDIGGPTMVRAAAKNFAWVSVVVDPLDYTPLINRLREHNGIDFDYRKKLAAKVFALTSQYETAISHYFIRDADGSAEHAAIAPDQLAFTLEKAEDLRYGENPHQKAAAYRFAKLPPLLAANNQAGILSSTQHQGKPLSYNNILDAEAALACVKEFVAPTCVIVKHANPCGVASHADINEAYLKAYAADALSAFGGIVALNQTCTAAIATEITKIFMEVIIAPAYTEEALALFATKPNLRVLSLSITQSNPWELRFVGDGVLLQEKDNQAIFESDLKMVTQLQPSSDEIATLLFAWKVLKHIKSNGILIAKMEQTVGVGAGQVSRVDAVEMAIRKAGENIQGAVLASDAFFPFRDSIDLIAKTGIQAIIQPGGSMRDPEVIAACNEHGLKMIFTGQRCFRH